MRPLSSRVFAVSRVTSWTSGRRDRPPTGDAIAIGDVRGDVRVVARVRQIALERDACCSRRCTPAHVGLPFALLCALRVAAKVTHAAKERACSAAARRES